MPKVTDEHRAARRQQILRAAWVTFARNGFHATSMADVIQESGLSAGAVYGYFRNKEDLILQAAQATIGQASEPIVRDLRALDPPDLGEAVVIVIEHLQAALLLHEIDKTPVAVQALGEAVRSPTLMSVVAATHGLLRDELAEVARRAQQIGRLDEAADPAQVGVVAFGMVPGLLVQRITLGTDVDDYCAGVRSLLGARPAAQAE